MLSVSSRRTFLGTFLGGLGVVAAAVISWPLLRYLAPRSGSEAAVKVIIPTADIREGEAKFFEFAGSSAVLIRKQGGELGAFSAVCTHLGCIVQWEKDKQSFLCPCHGGRFSVAGEVMAGPPPKPLKRLPVTVAGGTVTIG